VTPSPIEALPLQGRTIAVTAERRFEDQAAMFRSRGATVLHAPTMHTVDLTGDAELRRHTEAVIDGPPAWTVATTGFGMRLWFEAADAWGAGDALIGALRQSTVIARGSKARSVCRQRGLDVEWKAPSEAMPEVVSWLADRPRIGRSSVVVQLFDPEDHPSTAELRAIAGSVREVPVYRWRWPDDPEPARQLVERIVGRQVDAVTFTSQPAVRFLLEIAAADGREADVVAAFNTDVLPVCVGPVCAEAGLAAGIGTMVWPDAYRLAPMVRCAETHLVGRGTFGP
jgi:uroporphyrinogen-III synthase